MPVKLPVQLEREADGRWIVEVPSIPGVIVYGSSPEQALQAARRLAADVTEDRRMHGEPVPEMDVDADALTMLVGTHVATVAPGEATRFLVGYVNGLAGAHTQARYLLLSRDIGVKPEGGDDWRHHS